MRRIAIYLGREGADALVVDVWMVALQCIGTIFPVQALARILYFARQGSESSVLVWMTIDAR